jgi:alpha-L-fucosidase
MKQLTSALATLALLTPTLFAAPQDDARMKWWREARFGLFVHWGLYAIPAGAWGGHTGYGEWIRDSAKIPLEEYAKFQPRWNPVKFDAAQWAKLAKRAGMNYVVITSKHHDGFALFDSKLTDWDVMNTPHRRDIMKELGDAVRNEGMTMCFYHSIMDWNHPDYLPRRGWESRPTEGANFDRFVTYLHGQVTELLTNYGPIGVMWFDGEWESTWNHGYGQPLYDLCRRLQPNVIVNNRVDKGRAGMAGMTIDDLYAGDFGTPEQEIPSRGLPGVDWETCMTMNDHWGYNAKDDNWKSARQLIRMLCDIASKGGNFLLNVGPTAEGLIPAASVERLEAIGRWMDVNAESIHGTQASPFASLQFGRCTQRAEGNDTHLYFHVFDWPRNGKLRIDGLGNDPLSARVLGREAAVKITLDGQSLLLEVGDEPVHDDVTVVELVIAGAPIVYEPPRIEIDVDRFVTTLDVPVTIPSPGLDVHYTLDGAAPSTASPRVSGKVRIDATTTLRAQAFHRGKPVSAIVERRFEKVAAISGVNVSNVVLGLRAKVRRGSFKSVSELAEAAVAAEYIAPAIGLETHKGEEHFGVVFEGHLAIEKDDLYRFALTSDDGSRLTIGGQVVIDLDGLHGTETRAGAIALGMGYHPIRVEYFNGTGGAELDLRYAPLGKELVPPNRGDLVHE